MSTLGIQLDDQGHIKVNKDGGVILSQEGDPCCCGQPTDNTRYRRVYDCCRRSDRLWVPVQRIGMCRVIVRSGRCYTVDPSIVEPLLGEDVRRLYPEEPFDTLGGQDQYPCGDCERPPCPECPPCCIRYDIEDACISPPVSGNRICCNYGRDFVFRYQLRVTQRFEDYPIVFTGPSGDFCVSEAGRREFHLDYTREVEQRHTRLRRPDGGCDPESINVIRSTLAQSIYRKNPLVVTQPPLPDCYFGGDCGTRCPSEESTETTIDPNAGPVSIPTVIGIGPSLCQRFWAFYQDENGNFIPFCTEGHPELLCNYDCTITDRLPRPSRNWEASFRCAFNKSVGCLSGSATETATEDFVWDLLPNNPFTYRASAQMTYSVEIIDSECGDDPCVGGGGPGEYAGRSPISVGTGASGERVVVLTGGCSGCGGQGLVSEETVREMMRSV